MIGAEEAYRRLAPQYDAVANRTRDLDAVILREHGPSARGKTVLELGCGTGKNTEHLAPGCEKLIALDLSEEMLGFARKRITASHVTFLRHDLRRPWPLDDAAVDLVVANLVLEHVADVAFVFGEIRRVLRRGGESFHAELHPFRQAMGGGLEVPGLAPGSVEAYYHPISEYVNAALGEGLSLVHIGEWRDERDEANDAAPRLLTLHFRA